MALTTTKKLFNQQVLGKECCTCKEFKSLFEFGNARNNKDGLYVMCKSCTSTSSKAARRKRRKDIPLQYIYEMAKARAKYKGIDFTIALEDIPLREFCPILKTKLDIFTNDRNTSMSLDRVDSSKGYVPGNVDVISTRANLLKNNGTLEEFEAIVKYIKEHSN